MDKYTIHCPKCNTTHNVSEQLEIWKDEFIKELDKIVRRLKNEK
ncbi:hypothetical protein BMS3Abin17_00073 [archaeon BMS3Abin17]|nr:hypothetical protein BMS3Abin17_00073 [archaeon BMS3Abin17]